MCNHQATVLLHHFRRDALFRFAKFGFQISGLRFDLRLQCGEIVLRCLQTDFGCFQLAVQLSQASVFCVDLLQQLQVFIFKGRVCLFGFGDLTFENVKFDVRFRLGSV